MPSTTLIRLGYLSSFSILVYGPEVQITNSRQQCSWNEHVRFGWIPSKAGGIVHRLVRGALANRTPYV